ncbi:hypothetical protein DVH05_027026 [Phytophthora capsici]|nr:hypothetical protein DVH05_027026 [Phytophthora capsici]
MADSEAMDDVAFEAAMTSFLHEFKLTTDKVAVMEGDVSPDSHGPQKAALSKLKATERRDRYRKKLRNERETLRRQQRELSMELTRLQEAQAREKELEKARNTFALSAWRATAARQKEKRLQVEHEQQQLKAAVRCHAEAVGYPRSRHGLRVVVSWQRQLRRRSYRGSRWWRTLVERPIRVPARPKG